LTGRPGSRGTSPARAASFGITRVDVSGFRSAHRVAFSPGPLCALVGEATAGKSNLLAAIRAVLDPAGAPLTAADATRGGTGEVSIELRLADDSSAVLSGRPGHESITCATDGPQMRFFAAEERAGARRGAQPTPAAQALAIVAAVETWHERGAGRLLLLIEEPELYLRPQAQRYLYRLLREFAAAGNQVIYSTHSPAFLNVTRMNELVFVERLSRTGTRTVQPEPVSADEDFRVMTEFDAARGELFLARAVVLVEGLTEKLVLPFVFSSLGHDVDREAISIVECGGKPNLPLFARICRATGVPFLVVHDSDRKASGRLVAAERALNALIAETAGEGRVVVLDPDFEAVAGLTGRRHKPEHAWREFAARAPAEMPAPLVRVAKRAMSLVGATGRHSEVRR
jgi:putative ATP-dependent endonuclease of the OLD family